MQRGQRPAAAAAAAARLDIGHLRQKSEAVAVACVRQWQACCTDQATVLQRSRPTADGASAGAAAAAAATAQRAEMAVLYQQSVGRLGGTRDRLAALVTAGDGPGLAAEFAAGVGALNRLTAAANAAGRSRHVNAHSQPCSTAMQYCNLSRSLPASDCAPNETRSTNTVGLFQGALLAAPSSLGLLEWWVGHTAGCEAAYTGLRHADGAAAALVEAAAMESSQSLQQLVDNLRE